MKIFEQTSDRLVLRIGTPYFNSSKCYLDRRTGYLTIKRFLLFYPRKAVNVLLSNVMSVEVEIVMSTIEGSQFATAFPTITLRSGQRIKLFVNTNDDKSGPKAVAVLKNFLGL